MYHLHYVSRLWLILVFVFSWINGSVLTRPRLRFLREPEPQLYLEPGKINQLDCSFEDYSGNINQTWYLNDQPMNHEFTNVLLNGTLRFIHFNEDATSDWRDSMKGLYRCCISDNSLTLCSIASNVSFPSIGPTEVIASKKHANIGDILRLACHTETDPPGVITWFKDDANIAFDETRLILLPNDVIHITEVIESDEGSYKCVAENNAGMRVSPLLAILVSSELSSEERGAILNRTNAEVVGRVGGEVLLECLIKQANRVEIYWTKGSTPVPEDRRQIIGYGNILMKNLTLNDTGNYTCTSVDKRSQQVKITSIRLIVYSPPQLPTVWSERDTKEGVLLTLECPLSGIPEPQFAWYHNGVRVKSVTKYSYVHSSNLYVYNVGPEDAGLFQCFVWNQLGHAFTTTLVTVDISVEQSVKNLRITDITSTTAIARWELPDLTHNSSLTALSTGRHPKYQACVIFYAKLPDGIELSDVIRPPLNYYMLTDLDPDSNYSVSVRVFNSINVVSLLETVYMKTLEDVPACAPEITNVTSTPTTVTVQWLPLNDDDSNGVIVSQEVCLEQEATGFSECHVLDPSQTSYTFENLIPGVEYLTYLSASTSVGKGVNSNKYPRITPVGFNCTAPDNVPMQFKIVNTTFITFTWPPANGTQRDLIVGYRLIITIIKTNLRVDFLLLDANSMGYNKSNAGYDAYSVTFYAIGECGQGPVSTAYINMPEEVTIDVRLLSPNNLQMEALSKDKIKISWSRPITAEKVESYTIGYNAIGQPEDAVEGIEPDYLSPRMEYILSGLQTYTFYRVRVMACYSDGSIHSSIYEYPHTGEDKPGSPPRDVYAYTLDPTSINITWKAPLVPNGNIISYTIHYWSSNEVTAGWKEIEKQVDDDSSLILWLVLKNLQPNTMYTYNIRAATKVGKGPATRLHNIATKYYGTGASNPKNSADLRKGILTGVCLALLCIVVCVSLLFYHLRRSICRQQDWQCRSVATRTSTPGHYKGCRHKTKRWREPPDQDCSLSVLQTEFEMEHLMMRERPSNVPERLMIQVHHVDSNIPARGATSENPAEEPFLAHREPSPSEHHHTSQEIPPDAELPVIPQNDPKDQERLPHCVHCTSREKSTSDIILDKLSGEDGARGGEISPDVSGSHSSAMTRQDCVDRNLPSSSHDKCLHCQPHKSYLYSNETLPWSATSEHCRNMGPASSLLPLHHSKQTQEDSCSSSACQVEGEEYCQEMPSGSKFHVDICFDGQSCPHVEDQQSDISTDRDSGLDGEYPDEVAGTQDTSPYFLERVLEELSMAE